MTVGITDPSLGVQGVRVRRLNLAGHGATSRGKENLNNAQQSILSRNCADSHVNQVAVSLGLSERGAYVVTSVFWPYLVLNGLLLKSILDGPNIRTRRVANEIYVPSFAGIDDTILAILSHI